MSHDDFAFEPRRGLPAALPDGEQLLWQGSPDWRPLAIRAYHVRKAAAYFALLILWRVLSDARVSHTLASTLRACSILALLGGVAVAILCLLAYLNARSAVYSITSRRVLVRQGIAVCLTLNLPLKFIDSADLRRFPDGTGDIVMTLACGQRLGWLINWPHLRPRRFAHPEPSFRALRDAAHAAGILSAALAAESADTAAPPAEPLSRALRVPQTAAAA